MEPHKREEYAVSYPTSTSRFLASGLPRRQSNLTTPVDNRVALRFYSQSRHRTGPSDVGRQTGRLVSSNHAVRAIYCPPARHYRTSSSQSAHQASISAAACFSTSSSAASVIAQGLFWSIIAAPFASHSSCRSFTTAMHASQRINAVCLTKRWAQYADPRSRFLYQPLHRDAGTLELATNTGR